MKPPAKLNIDFVNQRMGRRHPAERTRDYPRMVVSSRHLTPEDTELLQSSRWGDPQNVVDTDDGFTLHRVGLWTHRHETDFEARMAELSKLGHSDGFVVAMRMAREKGAWTFRFNDHADTVDDLPIGGYEPGVRPSM